MFVIEIPYLNLDQIYDSGQAPRWIKLRESKYVIPYKDKALKIEQQRDRFDFNRYRFIMSCSEDEFCNIWFNYFDVETDYMQLNSQIKKLGGKFKRIAIRGSGIHIIKPDTFETYLYTKLVTNVGYENAKSILNHIAEVCGIKHTQSMREVGRITWYEFPTPEMILQNLNKLCNMGKINDWLKKVCEIIINHGIEIITESDNELFKLLGMHEVEKFPLTEIEDTLEKNFGENPEEFADWYLDDIENKGLVYMYILHHIKNPPRPKEIILNGINR